MYVVIIQQGVDLNDEQWKSVIESAVKNKWIPFLDFAYRRSLATALVRDRACLEKFAESGIDFLVASSFSKNLALYNERVGAITVVSPSKKKKLV